VFGVACARGWSPCVSISHSAAPGGRFHTEDPLSQLKQNATNKWRGMVVHEVADGVVWDAGKASRFRRQAGEGARKCRRESK